MKQSVTIIEKTDDKIVVACDKKACENCKGNFFCSGKEAEFEVNNQDHINVNKGDKVQIDIPAGKTIFTSFMSFGIPLIFFFVGLIIGFFIWENNQLLQFLLGTLFLVVAFAINSIYFKIYRKKFRPNIDKVINE